MEHVSNVLKLRFSFASRVSRSPVAFDIGTLETCLTSEGLNSVCSTITTASAPRGTMPPVAIVVAVLDSITCCGAIPGDNTSSFKRNRRVVSSIAPNVSAACTANPSTFDRSNAGTSTADSTSSARTRPNAAVNNTCSSPSGSSRKCETNRCIAVSRSMTSRN